MTKEEKGGKRRKNEQMYARMIKRKLMGERINENRQIYQTKNRQTHEKNQTKKKKRNCLKKNAKKKKPEE